MLKIALSIDGPSAIPSLAPTPPPGPPPDPAGGRESGSASSAIRRRAAKTGARAPSHGGAAPAASSATDEHATYSKELLADILAGGPTQEALDKMTQRVEEVQSQLAIMQHKCEVACQQSLKLLPAWWCVVEVAAAFLEF